MINNMSKRPLKEVVLQLATPVSHPSHEQDGRHLDKVESQWLMTQWTAVRALIGIMKTYNTLLDNRDNLLRGSSVGGLCKMLNTSEQDPDVKKLIPYLSLMHTRVALGYQYMSWDTLVHSELHNEFRFSVDGGMIEPRLQLADGDSLLNFGKQHMRLDHTTDVTRLKEEIDPANMLPAGIITPISVSRITFIPIKPVGSQNKVCNYFWKAVLSYTTRRNDIRTSYHGVYNQRKEEKAAREDTTQ